MKRTGKLPISLLFAILSVGLLTVLLSVGASAKAKCSAEDIQTAYNLLVEYAPKTIGHDETYYNNISSLLPVAQEATKNCNTCGEKIRAIYDLVRTNIVYDMAYIRWEYTETLSLDIWNEKRGVCGDYARLCCDFLELLGIPCTYVCGDNHSYNAAWDSDAGRWIIFDATWSLFDLKPENLVQLDMHELSCFSIEYGENEYYLYCNYSKGEYYIGIEKINDKAETVSIPDSISGFPIKDYFSGAFHNKKNLKTVYLPEGITKLQSNFFRGCSALEEIYIGKNLTYIGPATFMGCGKVTDIYYEGTEDEWKNNVRIDNYNGILSGAKIHYNHGENHSLKKLEQKKATLTANGRTACYYCTVCKNYYKNASATLASKCTAQDVAVYAVKTVSLSKTAYTYTGKEIKPSVTVKDSKGKTVSKSYYTLSYSKNKSVGKASVKITFKGKYSGTKTLTFKINPKATALSSLTAGKKCFTAKWKKNTTVSGYEIRYSTSAKFTAKTTKTVKISSASAVSKKISNLTGGKKYYVEIRGYKTVNNVKYYSPWSSAKTVTVKK